MVTIDCETVGLHGLIVLIQYSYDYEPEIKLHSPWEVPISDTLQVIDEIINHSGGILGFNLVFDFFHIYKMYCTWNIALEMFGDIIPEDNIEGIMQAELMGRDYPKVIKPQKACDVFLHARKNQYQSLMDRKDIKIKKIPAPLAGILRDELEKKVKFDPIYFSRRKSGDPNRNQWQIEDRNYDVDPYAWKNIVVRFKPSSGLKALAKEIFKLDSTLLIKDVGPKQNPCEFGYAPISLLAQKIQLRNKIKEKKRWKYKYRATWPDFIKQHITHWGHNRIARQYASDDIKYTRDIYKHFGSPEFGDDDSELTIMVACCRWRGFSVNLQAIQKLKDEAIKRAETIPIAPRAVKKYILDALDPTEQLGLLSTNKKALTDLRDSAEWKGHPAAKRAADVLSARGAKKEVEQFDKILAAGRFHASFKVIGTLSSRMAGADGLNAQAMKSTEEVKSCFTFTWIINQQKYVVCGGDFASFEVTIAEAVWGDEALRKTLLTCDQCDLDMLFVPEKADYYCPKCKKNKGKKIHALFGTYLFPGLSYEDLKATDGSKVDDKYKRSKSCLFLMMYGGNAHTMNDRQGINIEDAERGSDLFMKTYKGIQRYTDSVRNDFESMKQPHGIGTKVEWHEPKDYISTLFGFRRYFTLENRICKVLFDLANKPPQAIRQLKVKVMRDDKRGRVQTSGGACQSALYGAAFSIQSLNLRAAKNHVIQGSGAQITKRVQRRIWDIQPTGISDWLVMAINVHDQVLSVIHPDYVETVNKVVKETVEGFRKTIPLIKLPWKSGLKHWADK